MLKSVHSLVDLLNTSCEGRIAKECFIELALCLRQPVGNI